MSQVRRLALDALLKIEQQKAYSHLVLNQLLTKHAHLDPRDRQLLTELVYGTVQHQRLLDFYLSPYIKDGLDRLENWVKLLLRMSIYQLYFLDRIPPYAVVNEAVKLAKKKGHRGIQGLVNAVLRNLLRHPRRSFDEVKDPIERLAIQTSHPTWLVRRWVEQFGPRVARQICQANIERPSFTIRVNLLKQSRATLAERLRELGYKVRETLVSDQGLIIDNPAQVMETHLFKSGCFTIQSESSMLVAPLLNPEPGMRVLDLCAAPGGKTTHLAELMQNRGEIVANDLHASKVQLVKKAAERLGLTIIRTTHQEGTSFQDKMGCFDRILVDAPCSGFGVIKQKPDVKWRRQLEEIDQLAQLQFRLLSRAAKFLKRGGRVVYSTCTLERKENEGVIERFLQTHPNFTLVAEMRYIFPQDFSSDGFFVARLEKKE